MKKTLMSNITTHSNDTVEYLAKETNSSVVVKQLPFNRDIPERGNTANHRDKINVEVDDDYETNSHIKWNELLHECENYNLSDFNYDSSTILSESIEESSNDFENIDFYLKDLNVRPTELEKESSVNVSVEHSTDILIGNKTYFTGSVVIKNFIAESDTINVNQKDASSDSPGTSEISNSLADAFTLYFICSFITVVKEKTTVEEWLHHMHSFFLRRPKTIVTVVVGILIIIAAALCGYHLNSPGGK